MRGATPPPPLRNGPPPRSGEILEPPRNGEGDRSAQPNGGGVLSASDQAFKTAKRERRSGNLPEVLIWRELRKRPGGFKFRRQHPISELVLDFACLECRVAIEIDGRAHDMGERPERDERRDAYLRSRGFSVLRIPAADVKTLVRQLKASLPFATTSHPATPGPRPAVPLPVPGRF